MSDSGNVKSAGRDILKKRIAPGIWEDGDGNIHWSVPELLRMVALPDTPENREAVMAIVRQAVGAVRPDVQFIKREKPGDKVLKTPLN